jgi:hypothetical protein
MLYEMVTTGKGQGTAVSTHAIAAGWRREYVHRVAYEGFRFPERENLPGSALTHARRRQGHIGSRHATRRIAYGLNGSQPLDVIRNTSSHLLPVC